VSTTATIYSLRPPVARWRWPWLLAGAAVLGLVLLLMLASTAWQGVHGADGIAGLANVSDWHIGLDEHGWHGDVGIGGMLGIVVSVLVALFVLLVVLPLVLLGTGLAVGLALLLAALSVATALLLALGSVLLVLAVASSPLWLIGLVLWWALKPRKPAVASASS
jgi:hypothetical protein